MGIRCRKHLRHGKGPSGSVVPNADVTVTGDRARGYRTRRTPTRRAITRCRFCPWAIMSWKWRRPDFKFTSARTSFSIPMRRSRWMQRFSGRRHADGERDRQHAARGDGEHAAGRGDQRTADDGGAAEWAQLHRSSLAAAGRGSVDDDRVRVLCRTWARRFSIHRAR